MLYCRSITDKQNIIINISYRLLIEPAKINYVINTISFSLVKSYMVLRYALDMIFANLIGSGIEP